ncbi:MAG: hypothetical protein R3F59_15675 [Myxococcota bacterium]
MWWLALAAHAGSDVAVTSVGAQGFRAEAIGAQSADILLGQRVRWGVGDHGQALVDGRFLVSPGAELPFDESRVRQLGYALEVPSLELLVGRHPVVAGGRRLVDGVQAVARPGQAHAAALGAWAGLVPDEFTTAPTTRFGAGPVLGYEVPVASVWAVGDLVVGAGGVQRLAALTTTRAELGSRYQADGRLDWVFQDGAGGSGLADGAVTLLARPTAGVRFDGLYNAYSTLLYQSRASTDPRVQRFSQRIETLGLTEGITQDFIDPTLHHLLGAGARFAATGAIRPYFRAQARTQLHRDPAERYSRVGAGTGLGGLADDRLEFGVDGNLLWIDGEQGGDAGVSLLIEPVPDAVVAIDTSARLLFDPGDFQGAPGGYVDLFVDVAARSGTTVSAGGSWTSEPSDVIGADVGFAAYLRLQQWIRPPSARRPAPVRPGASDVDLAPPANDDPPPAVGGDGTPVEDYVEP